MVLSDVLVCVCVCVWYGLRRERRGELWGTRCSDRDRGVNEVNVKRKSKVAAAAIAGPSAGSVTCTRVSRNTFRGHSDTNIFPRIHVRSNVLATVLQAECLPYSIQTI